MHYSIQLNRTHLLYIPSPDASAGTVVQVCLRGDQGEGNLDVFSAEQACVTRAIETLLVGHVSALRELPERVIVKDVVPGNMLVGERKPWKYGRGKLFFHGDMTLQPAEHKWIFRIETNEDLE